MRSLQSILGGHEAVSVFQWEAPPSLYTNRKCVCVTHIAGRGDRPGLLSLPLLFPCSIAPFISSRMALARQLRVGLPMEAVVYRGMLFSATEA